MAYQSNNYCLNIIGENYLFILFLLRNQLFYMKLIDIGTYNILEKFINFNTLSRKALNK